MFVSYASILHFEVGCSVVEYSNLLYSKLCYCSRLAVSYASILHLKVGCSVVCDCCIFWSYLLAFCTHSYN